MPACIRKENGQIIIAALAAAFWWFFRSKPIAVVANEIDRGTVEASIANTPAGP